MQFLTNNDGAGNVFYAKTSCLKYALWFYVENWALKKFCLKMAKSSAKKVLTFNIHKAKGNIGVNESSMKSTKSPKEPKYF